MSWYEDTRLARVVAEERISPRREDVRLHRSSRRFLRPLLRAVMSWLF